MAVLGAILVYFAVCAVLALMCLSSALLYASSGSTMAYVLAGGWTVLSVILGCVALDKVDGCDIKQRSLFLVMLVVLWIVTVFSGKSL